MGPNQLDPSNLFVDEDPDAQQMQDVFVDYDPDDLQKMQAADLFSNEDPDALIQKQAELSQGDKRIRDNFYAPEKTAEEIGQMSMWEKMDYAKQLEKEFEYRQAKGYAKGVASGVSFGTSEWIPGMDKAEDDMLFELGEVSGAVVPVEGLYSVLGKPLVKLATKSPYAKKSLTALARMTGFGLIGASYEGTRDAVKSGEVPSIEDVAKHGAQWALLDGALQVAEKGVSFASKLYKVAKNNKNLSTQKVINDITSQLAKEKINPEVTPEKYATRAEEILDSKLPKEELSEAQGSLNTPELVEIANPDKSSFTTEKGSTYEVEGKTTKRNKAYRKEHGDAEQGPQKRSERTWYVTPENAEKLSEMQAFGTSKKIFEYPDGKIAIMYTEGPNAGKVSATSVVPTKSTPEVGLVPIEIWNKGESVHFGNKISHIGSKPAMMETKAHKVENIPNPINSERKVELKSSKMEISSPKETVAEETNIPKPIVETTGKGANEQIEYVQSSVDKTIDSMNTLIKSAKNPRESLTRLGTATNTAIFNFLAPLEKMEANIPVAERVSTKIKFAQTATSEINSVLENGIFSNITGNFEKGGLKAAYGNLQWKKFTKGLKPEEYSVRELNEYRHSRQALKRQAEGKKTGIDTQIAKKDVERLKGKYEPIAQRIRQYNRDVLETYGKDLLGESKLSKWDKDFETSLYRVMDSGENSILKSGSLKPKQPFKAFKGSERKQIPASESDVYNTSMLISNAKKNEAILQYAKGIQEGTLEGVIRKGENIPIPESVIKDLNISPEQIDIAENLYNQTRKNSFTPKKNTLRGWKNGQPIDIEVPEDIFNIFSTFTPNEGNLITKFVSATNRLFSKGITLSPRKFLSITSRDAVSAFIYSKTGQNSLSVFKALVEVFGNKESYKQFKAMGGDVYASRLAERIDRSKKIEDLITPGSKGIMVPFEKMGSYFSKYSESLGDISLAVPLAEYNRALAKYGNTAEGRIMAAMEARRVTYDPNRKGGSKIVRELGNYIPFWNVSLQDISMLGSNLKNKSTWIKGLSSLTVPTLLLKMTNAGNPDYEALNPVDKAAFWHIYFGDSHVRIPIPWLLGTTFKVGAEFFYDMVQSGVNNNDKKAKEAWQGLYENFTENLSGSVPPILQTYIEMATGKSAQSPLGVLTNSESRAPEVIPRRLQDLPPELQYTSKTSQLAKWFGQHWGMSPVKVERVIKNFGTLVAADVLALTDEIAYFSGLAEDKRPEQNEKNYLLLGNFVSDSTPTRTKYANEFYEHLREATLDRNAQKIIQSKGITDSGLDSVQSHGVNLFAYNRNISKLLKNMRTLEDDSTIKASEKKKEMQDLQKQINQLYKEAVEAVDEGKAVSKK